MIVIVNLCFVNVGTYEIVYDSVFLILVSVFVSVSVWLRVGLCEWVYVRVCKVSMYACLLV